jgi:uncharacterized protein YjbJ (UPF0337 family)
LNAKRKISNRATKTKGKLKRRIGKATGNRRVSAEGIKEQAEGTIKEKLADIKQ